MGVYNVSAALRVAPDKLTGSARLTLLAMALMTLDASRSDSPHASITAAGSSCASGEECCPWTLSDNASVRDIATLRKLGIVEVLEPGYKGHSAVYRLLLPVDKSLDFVDNGD